MASTDVSDQTWIYERVGSLPLIAEAMEVAASRYRQTKSDYPTLGGAMTQLETGVAAFANKAYPTYQTYLQAKVEFANKTAVDSFDYIEKNYPQIKITPNEVREAAQRYYEESGLLKGAVETALATKTHAVDWAVSTKDKGSQALDGAKDVVVSGTNVGVGAAVVGAQLSLAAALAAASLGVDAFRFTQQTGVETLKMVNRSEKVVREALLSALLTGKATANQVMGLAEKAVSGPREQLIDNTNAFLDLVDALVDRYISDGGAANSSVVAKPSEATSSIPARVSQIGSKVAAGLTSRAQSQVFIPLRQSIQTASDELKRALALMDYVKERRQWAVEQAADSYSRLSESVRHTLSAVERQAIQIKDQPEAALLRTIKASSGALSAAASELQRRSNDICPEPYRSQVQAAVAYVIQLDHGFSEASSLYDVRDEVVSEARERLGAVEQQLVSAVDKLADLPPLSWMTKQKKARSSSAPTETTLADANGHVSDGSRSDSH